jgi:hypothetical protein
MHCAGLAPEERRPFQRTLPPSSCPFILENSLRKEAVRLSWLTAARGLMAGAGMVGAGSSGG